VAGGDTSASGFALCCPLSTRGRLLTRTTPAVQGRRRAEAAARAFSRRPGPARDRRNDGGRVRVGPHQAFAFLS
jgi:hypothetical protein